MKLNEQIISGVQRADDYWQITGNFQNVPAKVHINSNKVIAIHPEYEITSELVEEKDVIVRRDILRNRSDKPIVFRQILARFILDGGEYSIYTQLNCWENESKGNWQPLITGVKAETSGVRTCNSATPMMAVWNEQTQRGIVYHVAAECAWKISVRRIYTQWHFSRIDLELGMHDKNFSYTLYPGEELRLPEIVFYQFKNKLDLDCFKLHRWFLSHTTPRKLPVVYNTWLYRFHKFCFEDIASQIPVAADLGCEYFVIDAGWFGKGASWSDSVGDWNEREDGGGFNGRMAELAKLVRKNGMKFGLWFEIERASANSNVVKTNKEIFFEDHGTYFLDFKKPEARKYMHNILDNMIKRYGIEYIKFDFNEDLPLDITNDAHLSYLQGYYQFIRELRERHCELYLLNCASGGFRMALSNARYFDSFWLSDNQSVYASMRILKETMLRLPPQWIDRWMSLYSIPDFPYHYGNEPVSDMTFTTGDAVWSEAQSVKLSYLEGFAMGGPIGLSCDLTKLSEPARDTLRKIIQTHKTQREFWQKCIARILTDTPTMLVLQYSNEAEDTIILVVITNDVMQNRIFVYPTVCHDAWYRIDGENMRVSGRELTEYGIPVKIIGRHECYKVTLYKET